MNSDQLKGHWNEFKGKIKEQFGKLTDDDLQVINGEVDQLVGKMQQYYGLSKEQAKKEIDNLFTRFDKAA